MTTTTARAETDVDLVHWLDRIDAKVDATLLAVRALQSSRALMGRLVGTAARCHMSSASTSRTPP